MQPRVMHTVNRISTEAVKKATGKSWGEWFAVLDKERASEMPHKEIVRLLREKGYMENSWWCQTVAGEYEKARGRRVVGETLSAGFEIGVQRTVAVSPQQAWEFISRPAGIEIWLGAVPGLQLTGGQSYQTTDGARGEIRSMNPGRSLRLTWQPAHRQSPSTLQVRIVPAAKKTSIRFHQEKLAGEREREQMHRHWQQVLIRLQAELMKQHVSTS